MTDVQIISVKLSDWIYQNVFNTKSQNKNLRPEKNYAVIGLEREKLHCDKSIDTFFMNGDVEIGDLVLSYCYSDIFSNPLF